MERYPGSSREAVEGITAVLQEEAAWRRVKHFVMFLHTGRCNILWVVLLIRLVRFDD